MKLQNPLSTSKTPMSTSEAICQTLRERILSGEFDAGMQLRQSELAHQFGVSHIPVREALQELKHEGLVEQFANRGAFVASVSLEELHNIWAVRRRLEQMATELAVDSINSAELEQADAILQTAREETDRFTLVRLNWEFHLCLYTPCGNDLLIDYIRTLYRKADRYSCVLWTSHDYGAKADREHAEILDCYRKGDAARAVDVTLSHVDEVERLVQVSLEE